MEIPLKQVCLTTAHTMNSDVETDFLGQLVLEPPNNTSANLFIINQVRNYEGSKVVQLEPISVPSKILCRKTASLHQSTSINIGVHQLFFFEGRRTAGDCKID